MELPVRLYSLAISLLSIPFLINHVFIWSEALFYALIILWTFIILKIEKDNSYKNWALIIAISVLICLQRKTGAIFVIVGVAYLLFKLELNIKNAIKIFSYLSLSSVFPIYWRIRYREIVNESYYIPNFSLKQTWEAINQEVTELGSWIVPRVFPDFIKWILVLVVLILIIKKLKTLIKSNVFLLSSILILTYSLSIIVVMTFYKLNQTIDIRVMGSILPFIIIIFGKTYSEYMKTKPSQLTLNIISLSLTFVFLYNIGRSAQNLKNWATTSKIGYPELVKLSNK